MKNFVNTHIKLYEHEVNRNSKLLRRKLKKILSNANRDQDTYDKLITPELFTKIGLITSQMKELTDDLENLVVQLDEKNPVELTEEDKQRIEDADAAKKLFTACFPYIFVQNMLLNSNQS